MKQFGIPFKLRSHWKKLFTKDSYFLYKQSYTADQICLRRFTIPNVIKWYFFQIVISLAFIIMRPICRLADRYWRFQEGADLLYITGRDQVKIKNPYWFTLAKGKSLWQN